jgi:hypothetical protein
LLRLLEDAALSERSDDVIGQGRDEVAVVGDARAVAIESAWCWSCGPLAPAIPSGSVARILEPLRGLAEGHPAAEVGGQQREHHHAHRVVDDGMVFCFGAIAVERRTRLRTVGRFPGDDGKATGFVGQQKWTILLDVFNHVVDRADAKLCGRQAFVISGLA